MERRTQSRRELLGMIAAGSLASLASPFPAVAVNNRSGLARRRSLRIAHITDVHVQPELSADSGFTKCLGAIHAEKDKPDLIVNTGDCVFDTMKQGRDRTELLWGLWSRLMRDEVSLPIEHAIGNHDVWGWNKKSGTTGKEMQWGKKRALDALGLTKSYRSFDRAGWHFIVLDSVQPGKTKPYMARLDDEQFEWLQSDLAATNPQTPVLVMSHIPIFSITVLMGDKVDSCVDGLVIPEAAMHTDYRRIKNLFDQHPNVKLAISGHVHLLDRVDYQGVSYLCNGAVSGGWWRGKNMGECDNGYTMLDLYDDGSFEHKYVNYGWVAQVPASQPATD